MTVLLLNSDFRIQQSERLVCNNTTRPESLNLSMCGDSSTNTKTYEKGEKRRRKKSCVPCQVSDVTCHLSPVTSSLSLTATASATYPYPTNYPIIHSSQFAKNQQGGKNSESIKIIEKTGENKKKFQRSANISHTLFDDKLYQCVLK